MLDGVMIEEASNTNLGWEKTSDIDNNTVGTRRPPPLTIAHRRSLDLIPPTLEVVVLNYTSYNQSNTTPTRSKIHTAHSQFSNCDR